MSAQRFRARVERGEAVAVSVLVIAFRIAVAVVFAPVALNYLADGRIGAAAFAAVCGLGLGAVLAPGTDSS